LSDSSGYRQLTELADGIFSLATKEEVHLYPNLHDPATVANSIFLYKVNNQQIDLTPLFYHDVNIGMIAQAIGVTLYAKQYQHGEQNPGKRTTPTAEYYRLYRTLKRWEKHGFLISRKGVYDLGWGERQSVWWGITKKAFTLIGQVQNSNCFAHGGNSTPIPESSTIYKKPCKIPKWKRWPNRTSPDRIVAIKKLNEIPTSTGLFTRPSPDTLNPVLETLLDGIKNQYNDYLDDINDKMIVLTPKGAPDTEYWFMDYRTRFNNTSRQLTALDNFEDKWREAEEYYDSAVFLTLTTDPKLFPNLWEANRHMSVAWNRYVSYLTQRGYAARRNELYAAKAYRLGRRLTKEDKDKGITLDKKLTRAEKEEIREKLAESDLSYRPRYVAVNEFQKNGLIHMHIMIFGRNWLDHRNKISADWVRCGQGQIVDVCAVSRNSKNEWLWTNPNKRPADARKDESAKQYLKKYLNKVIFDQMGFEHYWSVNKKFFQASQRMSPRKMSEEERAARAANREILAEWKAEHPAQWEYAGCMAEGRIPDWMERRRKRLHYVQQPVPEIIPAEINMADVIRPPMYDYVKNGIKKDPPGFISAAQMYRDLQALKAKPGDSGGMTLADAW